MSQATKQDPMKSMRFCQGECSQVPDQVCDAVLDTLTLIPGGDRSLDAWDQRAIVLASRMAAEGWRFCPCYSEGSTHQHARIFGLVHTDLANNLAEKADQESTFSSDEQNAA